MEAEVTSEEVDSKEGDVEEASVEMDMAEVMEGRSRSSKESATTVESLDTWRRTVEVDQTEPTRHMLKWP